LTQLPTSVDSKGRIRIKAKSQDRGVLEKKKKQDIFYSKKNLPLTGGRNGINGYKPQKHKKPVGVQENRGGGF